MMAFATLTDWLEFELIRKLASLPTDQARYSMLIQQGNVWQYRRQRFLETDGASEVPHPHYGPMTATDFILVLGMIDRAKSQLEAQRESA